MVENQERFKLSTLDGSKSAGMMLAKDGAKEFRFMFDDTAFPTLDGGIFESSLQFGENSVHLSWEVTVTAHRGPKAGDIARENAEQRFALAAAEVGGREPVAMDAVSPERTATPAGEVILLDPNQPITLSLFAMGAEEGKIPPGGQQVSSEVRGVAATKAKQEALHEKQKQLLSVPKPERKRLREECEALDAELVALAAENKAKVAAVAAQHESFEQMASLEEAPLVAVPEKPAETGGAEEEQEAVSVKVESAATVASAAPDKKAKPKHRRYHDLSSSEEEDGVDAFATPITPLSAARVATDISISQAEAASAKRVAMEQAVSQAETDAAQDKMGESAAAAAAAAIQQAEEETAKKAEEALRKRQALHEAEDAKKEEARLAAEMAAAAAAKKAVEEKAAEEARNAAAEERRKQHEELARQDAGAAEKAAARSSQGCSRSENSC